MIKICPKCGSIAEYNSYYGTVICTKCDWESEQMTEEEAKDKYITYSEWRKEYYKKILMLQRMQNLNQEDI